MEDKKISVEELKAALGSDIEFLLKEVADSINNARPGSIIADSEEPVHDAVGRFRQLLYEKAIERLQENQASFSPEGDAK
ncbi:MAG: hypothetical protein AB7F23_10290 [Phycisphaerae bacterium]|jgi:hypothetical protein